jgi:aspartate ammonia-lyase
MSTRTEHDLLGSMEVPAEAYYGIHTLRAAANFDLSGLRLHTELVRALAEVKKACAIANARTGYLEQPIADAICAACDEIIASPSSDHSAIRNPQSAFLPEQFITDPFQGGAGTSANMNANEVIANRAIELLGGAKGDYDKVHPLDHVNLSQSTNDVFPTAVRIAAIRLLVPAAHAMADLQRALQAKEAEFAGVLKVGRTEMQDAVPVTLGQEFAAWAQAVQRDWWRLYKVEERLRQVNLGGTAVGTGLNADKQYVYSVVEILRDVTGLPLARAENMIDVTQNCDVFVEVSGLIKAAAVNIAKIAADLRLLSSGPRAGLGEITLPALQAGSSIMPGKVNPVATEAASQCAFQIMANDVAIATAAASGQLELNAFLPMISHNLFQSLQLLRGASILLAEKCIHGIEANEDRCRELVENSFVMLTALSPYIGYEAASDLAQESIASGKTIRQTALDKGLFTAEQLDKILSTVEMTKPGIAGEGTVTS